MKVLIKNARLHSPSSPFHGSIQDIFIDNGIISKIGTQLNFDADTVIDQDNIHVSVGWMDCFANFCDPGQEFRETLQSGANAAAAGGFTEVMLIPNTQPVVSGKSQVEYLVQKGKHLPVTIHPIGSITKNAEGKDLAEMYDMYHSGAIAFSDGISPVQSSGILQKALEYILSINATIIQLPDDKSIGTHGLMNEGLVSTQLGLPGKPALSEELMIARDIEIVRYTGSKIHFTGISTRKSLELIAAAKAEGLYVSCSVTPYHLYFSDADLTSYDTNLKVNPPLRTDDDREALRAGVLSGIIDFIASHHQPYDWDHKICEFEYAKDGMESLESIFGAAGGKFNIEMQEKVLQLKEVCIELGKELNIRGITMGANKIDIASMKTIPTAFGEVDILRAVLTLPGVKSVGEASTGLNVRGGATDQNLILFNGLNIFNPSHLFGFFSAFDPDVIKDVTLYKSSIPASYGGRLSSVLDITSLDGNTKKLSGSAGIGPLTGKLTLEGPLIKDKTTFVAGVRTTYSNWLFNLLPDDYKKSKASFQDGTIHISHKVNNNNNIYINGYMSGDKFNLNSDTAYQYQNKNANIKWKHNFNNRFYGVFSLGTDHYNYEVGSEGNPVNAYKLSYSIGQQKLNADFSYFLNNKHRITFGLSSLYYSIKAGSFLPVGKESLVRPDVIEKEQALESAIYVSDKYEITRDLSVEAGIRFSVFNYLGPKNVVSYAPGLPLQESNSIGTDYYSAGKFIKTYGGPEYRLSARYTLSESSSIKASYNSLRQYIHMLSNTTAISPTDIWKLSDPNIKPQQGSQVSLGFYKNFKSNTIEASVEVYYKWIDNYLDYKSGAALIMNHHIETDVFKTRGKSYGAELLIKKVTGKLNGWFGYTYSRSLIKQNDPLAGELINDGKFYPSNFDQPHNTNLISNYKLSHRFSVSFNVSYSTGRPITLPIGVYDYAGSSRLLYSDRNGYRIPDYFRTDFSVTIDGNHKVHQLTHNSWTFGLYNITARKNAYSVYFVSENGSIKGYKLSIFGTAIPFLTYNIRF